MVSSDLLTIIDEQWRSLQASITLLSSEIQRASQQPRAEVGAAVPTFDSSSDFPAAGTAGRWAFAIDTSKLYIDNGAAWKEISYV